MISFSITVYIIHNWRPLYSSICLIPQGFSKASFQIIYSLLFLPQKFPVLLPTQIPGLVQWQPKKKSSLTFLPQIHLFFFLATNHRWMYNSSALFTADQLYLTWMYSRLLPPTGAFPSQSTRSSMVTCKIQPSGRVSDPQAELPG